MIARESAFSKSEYFTLASVRGSVSGKVKCSGETAGTEAERNDRRRAADGSQRDCVFVLSVRDERALRCSETCVGRGLESKDFAF